MRKAHQWVWTDKHGAHRIAPSCYGHGPHFAVYIGENVTDTPPADECDDCGGKGCLHPDDGGNVCKSCGGKGVRPAVTDAEWKHMALHALSGLRALGVPIEKIVGMTPEVLEEVARYQRESEAYT